MNESFPDAEVHELITGDRKLRYMKLHRHDSLPTLFFLHGSPSSMSVYNIYYEDSALASWANIIAADRPGYGFSEIGKSEISVVRQAELMWDILEKEGFPSPLYIIGSSYGGTVAVKMSMLEPDRVHGLMLVSASMKPGAETIYDISYLINYPPVRWLMPKMIQVANDEKLSHKKALKEMLPYWERITAPVVMLQGANDKLIFPENVSFAQQMLVNSRSVESHILEDEGHFLQLEYKDFILEKLQQMIYLNNLPEKVEELSIQVSEQSEDDKN